MQEYLLGDWKFSRNIKGIYTNELIAHIDDGYAFYTKLDENKLKYYENGLLFFSNNNKNLIHQNYIYLINNNKMKIYNSNYPVEICFSDIDITKNRELKANKCICDNDSYETNLILKSENEFNLTYIVKGESKNYIITTNYERIN